MERKTDSPPTPESKMPIGEDATLGNLACGHLGFFGNGDESPEEAARRWLIGQPLWMPLYRHAKKMIRQLNGFNQTIRGAARNSQTLANVSHPLMMVTVDMHDGLAQHIGRLCGLLKLNLMHQQGSPAFRLVMSQGAGQLVGKVSKEAAAQSDIYQLETPANSQERFAI